LFIRKANALGTKSLTKTCKSKGKINSNTASSDIQSLRGETELKYKKTPATKQSKIQNSAMLMANGNRLKKSPLINQS
jgi:hypothetical protein